MRPGSLYLASSLAVLAAGTPAANAATVFPAGTESKTAGLESSLASSGAPSVLYNPANLRTGTKQPYVEVGFVSVTYSYEHPDFDPVVVQVNSPVATLGYAQPLNDRLTIGGVLFPSANGKTEIPGLPRKVGGSVVALEVENEDQVIDLGLGASYKVTDDLSLGLALDHTVETHKLRANIEGNAAPLVDINYKNQFDRPVFGARYSYRRAASAAFAFRPAQSKSYKGTETRAAAEGHTAPRVRSYEPATVSFGGTLRAGGFSAGAELQRQFWHQGRSVVKDGIAADSPDADLKDVTQASLTAGYTAARLAKFEIGYARLPSPWGDGRDNGLLDDHVHGVDFGQLNGVDRKVYSASALTRALGTEMAFALSHSAGSRQVDSGGDNVGYYSLGVTTVSGSVKTSF